jgi:hypothetical protein
MLAANCQLVTFRYVPVVDLLLFSESLLTSKTGHPKKKPNINQIPPFGVRFLSQTEKIELSTSPLITQHSTYSTPNRRTQRKTIPEHHGQQERTKLEPLVAGGPNANAVKYPSGRGDRCDECSVDVCCFLYRRSLSTV